MSNAATKVAPLQIHPFEKAGLGKAPFRFFKYEVRKYQACPGAPIQPGTSCDYCGTAIMGVYWIRSADKKEFKVGCDCVWKTLKAAASTAAEREARQLWQEVLDAKRKATHKNVDERVALAIEVANQHEDELFEIPMPAGKTKFPQSVGKWMDWMLKHSGRKGKLEVAKLVEKIAAEQGWS